MSLKTAGSLPSESVGIGEPKADTVAHRMLAWYDRERRDLPWRAPPATLADPYRVWLSEIMLQQTTVKTVIPYFTAFLERWPTLTDLASASEDDILAAWAGLGYYSRARNLVACARTVTQDYGGRFPDTEAELRVLPGIGPYTAAAITAIAFGRRTVPVDGNIERIVARLFAITIPLPGAKAEIARRAATLALDLRAGDFAQALMDLGATICTPRRPSCLVCPIASQCVAFARGLETQLPRKAPKTERPTRHGVAFLTLREDGCLLLRKRPDKGLLARMLEVPSTDWQGAPPPADMLLRAAPVHANWSLVPGTVVHTFTHFRLELTVQRALVGLDCNPTLWANPALCQWAPRTDLARLALPSLMRKIIAHGLA